MLQYFSSKTNKFHIYSAGEEIDPDSIWYDLSSPQEDEIKKIEQLFNLKILNQEGMKEIEASSRVFRENDLLYMTFNILASSDKEITFLSPITFILSQKSLFTIRYVDPKPFQIFIKRLEKNFKEPLTSERIFLRILEAVVDRLADILEMIGAEIDEISKEIFKEKSKMINQRELNDILKQLGKNGDLSNKTRESLGTIGRVSKYVYYQVEDQKVISGLQVLQQDVNSLSDHLYFLLNKINFLLDATLGFINIEQNNVIKVLSGAAVIFLPPTLIASIYGMNFKVMPELKWPWGYPIAILVMALTAILPYLYFKRKRWL